MKKYEMPTAKIEKFDVEDVMLGVSNANSDPGWGDLID